jgi:predicted 3-demethylubiquinone-9 3-methyltransferase (glyoxalase superfamily)
MSLRRPRVTPFLWYDGQAAEAARFYVSVFGARSRVTSVSPMSVAFELDGQPLIALNGGPSYKFTEAFSLMVECRDQREIDRLWRKLGAGGQPGRCGWLKDRWGLSWQVVPAALGGLIGGSDREGAQRAMAAMLRMGKLDLAKLRRAYAGPRSRRRRAARPGQGRRSRSRGAGAGARRGR